MIEAVFTCPYCWQHIDILIDPGGGRRQVFTTDCEVCCRPVVIEATLDGDGGAMIDATAELSE